MKYIRDIILILSILLLFYVLEYNIFILIVLTEMAIQLQKVGNTKYKQLLISFYVVLLIFIYAYLKYSTSERFYLPLGYSVFSFSVISYITDNKTNHFGRLETYSYLFFVPKFFAGPIVKIKDFASQLHKPYNLTAKGIYKSIKIFIFAYFCKFVFANYLYIVDCDNSLGINSLCNIIIYGIAFYFDFYAYSLFAIGSAILLGINLPMNFNSPYTSQSFHEFWKRWNITLSIWLKDYIYIPLGGNKKGLIRKYLNIFIVLTISALWHGVTIPFLTWGLVHSFLLIIERWKKLIPTSIYTVWVFLTSCILWQLFRVNNINDFTLLLKRLCTYDVISINSLLLCVVALFIMLVLDNKNIKDLVFCTNDNDRSFIYKEVSLLSIMLILSILLTRNISFNFFYLKF